MSGNLLHNHSSISTKKKPCRRTQKEEKERYYQQLFPEYKPTYLHSIFYINRCSTADELRYLIEYAEKTNKFSADMESDCDTNEPALIQVFFFNAVHDSSPLLLIETQHLPPKSSPTFVHIQQLFHVIFRLDSEIYCWGNLHNELSSFIRLNLFSFPLPSTVHNTQASFRPWFNAWLNEQSQFCHNSVIDNVVITDAPYDSLIFPPPNVINELKMNKKENWSIQDAVAYLFQQYLSKQYTLQRWSCGLDPRLLIKNNKYSINVRSNMIDYAKNDVLSLAQIELFMSQSSIKLAALEVPPSSQYKKKKCKLNLLSAAALSSDDDSSSEIFMDQLVTVHDINERHSTQPSSMHRFLQQPTATAPSPTHITVESIVDPVVPCPKRNVKRHRSIASKKRRNKKSNIRHRRNRYHHELIRPVNMSVRAVKDKLKSLNIKYININIVRSHLYIGVKSAQHQQLYEERLPMDMFL